MRTELTFYRNPSQPIEGTTPSSSWKCPGNALSASSVRIYGGCGVVSATWTLVWDPSAGATYNAVRLVSADNGPSNEQQIAFINANNKTTPIVSSVNITSAINAILCQSGSKQLLMQTCGDTPSLIYRSTIDLVWA